LFCRGHPAEPDASSDKLVCRTGYRFEERIFEERRDRFTFVGAVAAPIVIEITALLKEIELCRSDIDRPAIATDIQAPAKCPTRRVDI
jgi:hypothetical protein